MSQATALIDQLKDIHTPEPISWWPLAPGWWILISCTVLLIALAARYLWKITRPNAALRSALNELDKIRQGSFSSKKLDGIAQLLRRCFLTQYSNEFIASRPLRTIVEQLKDQVAFPLDDNQWQLLDSYRYRPDVSIDDAEWRDLLLRVESSIELIFIKRGRTRAKRTWQETSNV